MKKLVIGLGNPLLGDDGVGVAVARELAGENLGVDVVEMNTSGFSVAEAMLGYDVVVVVDAIAGRKPGRIHRFSLDAMSQCMHFTSAHDTNIATAIEFMKRNQDFPRHVKFVCVEIIPKNEFDEGMSEDVKKAVIEAKNAVLDELNNEVMEVR
jgi:hydrogenase maturation protease